jgi:Xaa-Pro aminopeptidase
MEMACADKLKSLRRENDHFQGLSFPTISGAGPNGAIVHYRVSEKTDRALEPGTLYLVDSGAQYLDGTTDVTRTIAIGKPTAEMRRNFTLVLKGHIALATARFPEGTTGSQLDVLARRALWADGLDYDHGTGHGVGHYLGVHEGPQRISKVPNRVALEPGMVVSNEPGYYKPGAYGIRIENLVCVTSWDSGGEPGNNGGKDILGFETLTLAPLDRALIDPELLTADEIAWTNAYHARVTDEIGPLVDKATKEWLEQATRPID